jgi:hypothetical protein
MHVFPAIRGKSVTKRDILDIVAKKSTTAPICTLAFCEDLQSTGGQEDSTVMEVMPLGKSLCKTSPQEPTNVFGMPGRNKLELDYGSDSGWLDSHDPSIRDVRQ